MKYPVTRFKSLAVALREIEPFIRNGEHLQTGKPFKKFGCMRSLEREFFARLCAPAQQRCTHPVAQLLWRLG
jgi:hypothetical protein